MEAVCPGWSQCTAVPMEAADVLLNTGEATQPPGALLTLNPVPPSLCSWFIRGKWLVHYPDLLYLRSNQPSPPFVACD